MTCLPLPTTTSGLSVTSSLYPRCMKVLHTCSDHVLTGFPAPAPASRSARSRLVTPDTALPLVWSFSEELSTEISSHEDRSWVCERALILWRKFFVVDPILTVLRESQHIILSGSNKKNILILLHRSEKNLSVNVRSCAICRAVYSWALAHRGCPWTAPPVTWSDSPAPSPGCLWSLHCSGVDVPRDQASDPRWPQAWPHSSLVSDWAPPGLPDNWGHTPDTGGTEAWGQAVTVHTISTTRQPRPRRLNRFSRN